MMIMAFSKDPADYRTFVRPDMRTSVETLVDEWVIRGPYRNPAAISWEALRAVSVCGTDSLCIADGMRCARFGHDVSRSYQSLAPVSKKKLDANPGLAGQHLSVLEARVFGRCCERLGWIEFVRDDELDIIDARREFQRQSAVETDERKAAFGGLRDVDDLPAGTLELMVKISHQVFVGILSVGTPISSSDSETGTGWQRNLSCSQSPTCFGGQYDAVVVGHHTGQRVLCDIKMVDHSVDAKALIRFNPKNQIQLLLYLILVAQQDDIRDDEIPTGLAWVNPLRGVVEFLTADVIIQNMGVIERLASRALCLPDDVVEKVVERLSGVLTATL